METKELKIEGLCYDILKHTWFNTEEDAEANAYCQCVVRAKGDEFGSTMKWNFFVNDRDVIPTMEKSFPKSVWLAKVVTPAPGNKQFFRKWTTDGNGHKAGEWVSSADPETGEMVEMLFSELTVVCRCLPPADKMAQISTILAPGEDPKKFAMRTWLRGKADGTIVEIEDDEAGTDDPADAFANTTSEDDGIQPTNPGNGQGQGQGQRQGNQPPTRPANPQFAPRR